MAESAGVVTRYGEAAILAGKDVVTDGVAEIARRGGEKRERRIPVAGGVDLQHVNSGPDNRLRPASIDKALEWLETRRAGNKLAGTVRNNHTST